MNPRDLANDKQEYKILAYLTQDKSTTLLPTGLNLWNFTDSRSTELMKLTMVSINCQKIQFFSLINLLYKLSIPLVQGKRIYM